MIVVVSGIGRVTTEGMGPGRNLTPFSSAYGGIPGFSGQEALGGLAYHRFGRMDDYSKLGLAAISFALEDAGLDGWKEKRPVGIIASTVYGCLSTDFDYFNTVMLEGGGGLASPNLFAYTLPNSFLGDAAICFGLTGPSFVVNESSHAGLKGFGMAVNAVLTGESDTVLAGICDLGRPSPLGDTGESSPFAVFLVIEKRSGRCGDTYGVVDLNRKGKVVFNGRGVDDLFGLVGMCMAGPRSGDGSRGPG